MFESTMRYSNGIPLVNVDPEAAASYRPGTTTMGADELPLMQKAFPGTPAHDKLYGTRNQVEAVNGRLRQRTDLGPRYHRSFSHARRSIWHGMLGVAHNFDEQDRWLHEQALASRDLDGDHGGHVDHGHRLRRSDARRAWSDVDRDRGRPFGASNRGHDPPPG